MASTQGKVLTINFAPANGRAPDGLGPGQCSWVDRGLRPGEPTRVVETTFTSTTAQQIATRVNGGMTWTFWVFNDGRSLRATTDWRGTTTNKPHIIDQPQ